ncbi:hypothetical protein ACFLY0_01005 [Patescibacteria group bacterium]
MMKELFIVIILFFVLIAIGLGSTLISNKIERDNVGGVPIIINFEECELAGYTVVESYPRRCYTPDGIMFIEKIDIDDGISDTNECLPAGCSSQLCVEADIADTIVTTCEFKEEYMCYKEAKCERQETGQCGWTMTDELGSCLDKNLE